MTSNDLNYEKELLKNGTSSQSLIDHHEIQIKNLLKEINELKSEKNKKEANQKPEALSPTKKLKKTFLEFISIPWCYGLSKLSQNKAIHFRVMWLIFILFSTGLCFLFVINSIQNYYKWSVVTEAKIVFNTTLLFPQVIICKDNSKLANEYQIITCEFNKINCIYYFDEVVVSICHFDSDQRSVIAHKLLLQLILKFSMSYYNH